MSSNINVVVVDQTTDESTIAVPDTGNFSSGIFGSSEIKTISIIALIILILVSIASIIFIKNKRRKRNT